MAALREAAPALLLARGLRDRRVASVARERIRLAAGTPRPSLALLRSGAFTVALDLRGVEHSSEGWSAFLAEKKLHGHSHFQFILGGAAGLDDSVLSAADARWSLAKLTFPHQMARCIVLEQYYRAFRIERGEPYHH